ncbi:hypothetical protein JCM18916_1719 [Cutibacterium acnes JCM 18916]|nr:hypothetical protein JCM18916_1719 [Cutibacterium acnes JCM 18916]
MKVTATPAPGTKQDALFLEAKKVYETYLEQIYKLEVGDGVNSVSAELQGILSEDGTERFEKRTLKRRAGAQSAACQDAIL